MLLASGYLKVSDRSFDEKRGRFVYSLELTNKEVKLMFEDMIRDWFSEDSTPYNDFLKAFLCPRYRLYERLHEPGCRFHIQLF